MRNLIQCLAKSLKLRTLWELVTPMKSKQLELKFEAQALHEKVLLLVGHWRKYR